MPRSAPDEPKASFARKVTSHATSDTVASEPTLSDKNRLLQTTERAEPEARESAPRPRKERPYHPGLTAWRGFKLGPHGTALGLGGPAPSTGDGEKEEEFELNPEELAAARELSERFEAQERERIARRAVQPAGSAPPSVEPPRALALASPAATTPTRRGIRTRTIGWVAAVAAIATVAAVVVLSRGAPKSGVHPQGVSIAVRPAVLSSAAPEALSSAAAPPARVEPAAPAPVAATSPRADPTAKVERRRAPRPAKPEPPVDDISADPERPTLRLLRSKPEIGPSAPYTP